MPGSRVAHRRLTLAAAVLAGLVLAGSLPVAGARAADPDDGEVPAEQPSDAYLEAMAHEDDRTAFTPGGRVQVPFRPRAADQWPIDGQPPRALAAGRASGRQMAATPNGVAWADLGPGPGADRSASPDLPSGSVATLAETPTAAVAAAGPEDLRRQVFGFLTHWELNDESTRLNYDVLSTIAYFAVGADAKGDLRKRRDDGRLTPGWAGWTSAAMTKVIDRAHEHGTRVVLTIGSFAWTPDNADVQRSLLGSRARRENLARQAAAAVRDRGADGINLDFEPVVSGYADEYVLLIRQVRAELNRIGPGYELTYDTTGYIGNYPLEEGVGPGWPTRSSSWATATGAAPRSLPARSIR